MVVGLMGFFVLHPEVIDYIDGDATIGARSFCTLATDGQLTVYRHSGFWHPMDTLRDRIQLEELWTLSKAPWKVW